MENQSEGREVRRSEIGDRIDAIRVRITDLCQARGGGQSAASIAQLVKAQHNAATSKAAARRALISSSKALLRAAEAHDRCAISHERLAASDVSSEEHHRAEVTRHRAAAAADRQRAKTIRALLYGRAGDSPEDQQQADDAPSLVASWLGHRLKDGPGSREYT